MNDVAKWALLFYVLISLASGAIGFGAAVMEIKGLPLTIESLYAECVLTAISWVLITIVMGNTK